jgi:DNA adenine methylase
MSRTTRPSREAGCRPAALTPATIRPFLKWAGGKRQLLPQLRRFYPREFGTYFEPFVGSGAVFFDLHNLGLLEGRTAVLIDSNSDLLGCYLMVRDQVEAVVRNLRRLALERKGDAQAHYYAVRDRRFNPQRKRLNGQGGGRRYTPLLAAMLIYLNRTGFNGLFRQNASGVFNVPVGRHVNPRICDPLNLRRVASALSASRTRLAQGDFGSVLKQAQAGDFLYFDPPYAPLNHTALFTAYTAGGFGELEQVRLQQVVIELAARGCHVLLSNSTAPLIAHLYDGNADAEEVGLRARQVPARRAINSDASRRGEVREYLVTNVREREIAAAQPRAPTLNRSVDRSAGSA